ncbi:FecR domain-containing protein [Terricaulis sp.]|uniref:FecR domain-containing protein n=1 Tax=Terricaulis sp. TaxID=2768686 RepID=UPI00378369E1
MLKNILLLAMLTLLACMPADVFAQEPSWRLTSLAGQVRVAIPGQSARAARLNETVPDGTVVVTSANSSAVIENGLQRMTMSANSRMTIARARADGMTRIFQDLGTVLFQVDHRDAPHFRVETPLLAAIVKGTTFRVINHRMYDSVVVEDGLVEVDANQGGQTRDVPTGGAVTISRDEPTQLLAGTGIDGSIDGGGPASLPGGETLAAHARLSAPQVSGIPNSTALLRRISDPEAGNGEFVKFFLGYLAACLIFGYIVFLGVSVSSKRSWAQSAMADRVITPSENTLSEGKSVEPSAQSNRALRDLLKNKTRK